jgi:hypothetical protein
MAMRWYQHSTHGVKRAISEKYRLPSVAVSATAKASHRAAGAHADRSSLHEAGQQARLRSMAAKVRVRSTPNRGHQHEDGEEGRNGDDAHAPAAATTAHGTISASGACTRHRAGCPSDTGATWP